MITVNQRRHNSRYAHITRYLQLALALLIGWSTMACEGGQRFKVPATYRRMQQRAVKVYRPQGKIPIPKAQTLPLWSEMVDLSNSSVFRSELVTLQGIRWSRESSSKIYDIYFRSDNHMAARTLSQVSDQLAFFVTRWFGRPFPGRVSVILMPMSSPPKQAKETPKTPTPTQPRAKAPQPSPQPTTPQPATRGQTPPQPVRPKVPQREPPKAAVRAPAPTSRPTSRPTANKATSRPASQLSPQPRAAQARPQPPTKQAVPTARQVKNAPAAARGPAAPAPVRARPREQPKAAPATPRAPVAKQQAPAAAPAKAPGLAVPDIGVRRIVIYTGTTNNPVYSRYGLISALLSRTVRVFLTGNATPDRRAFWRSVVTPAYFALRGTGAMVDRSYDRTATPTLRNILRRLGRPTIAEVQRSIKAYQQGTLPKLLQGQAEHLAMSMLGFLEDAYGRGVLAAVLRHQLTTPKASFEVSAAAVIGQPMSFLWRQWFHYYYKDLWRDVLRGRAQLRDLPLAPSQRRTARPAGRRP